jgi:poly-gamma-glutamate capsule biosynthesis protein CapA/YwtB (metallophosphatase superfamily)
MQRSRVALLTGLVLAGAVALSVAAEEATAPRRVPDGFTFAAAGDLLGPYKESAALNDPLFLESAGPIHAADAAFANEEGSAFDKATFSGYTGAENGGGYPLHPLAAVRAFRALGFGLLSCANNHASDYGIEGLLATRQTLIAVGFAAAGCGRSLDEARAPAFFDSPRGRVALIAAASSYTNMSPAGGPNRGLGPRPGIAVVHNKPITLVTGKEMAAIRQIALRGGWQGTPLPGPDVRELTINDATFRVTEHPGLTYDVQPDDERGLVAAVAEARRNADVVAFSIHAHETASGGYDDPVPADFLPSFFHALIDAGADVIVRHGPHLPLGIEVYHGKPIFYGLGSFVFDLPRSITTAGEGPASSRVTIEFPREWFDSAVAVAEFKGGVVSRIMIYPRTIDTEPGPTHGLPRTASHADALRILGRMRDASVQFKTRMTIENDLGIIQPQQPGG